MEMIVLRELVIITSVCSLSAKHVYISDRKPWLDAQEYCRTHHTDLSPLTSELEDQVFRESVGESSAGWIGLYMDRSSSSGWKWSGGVDVTYQNWASQGYTYNAGYWSSSGWYAEYSASKYNFFCLNLIVVEEMKSWEEALDHCRDHYANFTSLLSETELLLAQKEIQKDHITDRVWIDLCYLDDGWLWVNEDPLEYEAWPKGGDLDRLCPMQRRCGALTKEGLWETWDCQEKTPLHLQLSVREDKL